MRRLTKVLVILFGILFVLIGVLASALFLLPETDWIRSTVQQQLQQQTGQEVVLGSLKVRPTFPGLVRLTVEGISVQSKAGVELFSADRVTLLPAPFALVKGELSIGSVIVEHFKVHFTKEPNGQIKSFLPIPSATASPMVEEKIPHSVVPPQVDKPDSKPVKQAPPAQQAPSHKRELPGNLTWSVKSIKLVKGSIVLIDSEIVPGRKTVIPFTNVRGTLSQQDTKEPIQLDLSAQFGDIKSAGNNIKVMGTVLPTPDFSSLSKAHVNVVCESILLKYVRAYIPPGRETRVAKQFNLANITADIIWEKPDTPIIGFKVDLMERPRDGAKLNAEGSIIAASDFSGIKQVRWKAESDRIPLKFLAVSLPPDFPLHKQKGVLRIGLRGEWTYPAKWKLSGSVKLDDAFPKKQFNVFGSPIRILAQVNVKPNQLEIESLEVSRKSTLASVTGKVLNPFSGKPKIDLNCKAQCDSKCMRRLGMRIPPEMKIQGAIPVIADVKGIQDDIWIDMRGDLTPVGITWKPFLEKLPGRKGSINIRGKLLSGGSKKQQPPRFNGLGNVNITGVKLRPTARSPWLLNSQVLLDTKIRSKHKTANLTDVRGSVRVGAEARDLLTITGRAVKLGSADPDINLRARLHFNRRILLLSGTEIPPELVIQGSAPLRAIIKGSTKLLNWWFKFPLVPLDISYKDQFRKTVGVQGEFEAHGNWSEKQFNVKQAKLAMPGLKLLGVGTFKTNSPNARQLNIKLDQVNLKKALKYFPKAAKLSLTGPVKGNLTISPSGDEIKPVGTIQCLGVNLSSDKSPWRLAGIKGTVKIDGDSLTIHKLTGKVGGVVRGPFSISGQVEKVKSPDTMVGKIALTMKDVELEQRSIVNLVKHARNLVGILLAVGSSGRPQDLVRFETVSGDFKIAQGTARTENLRLHGSATNMGLIGVYHLVSSELNMLVGIRTMVISGQALTRIPTVKKFVKKHEGFLKITGLDKELGRLGIKIPKEGESDINKPIETRTPAVIFLRIQGPAKDPKITPVLADSLDKKTESSLKSLIE